LTVFFFVFCFQITDACSACFEQRTVFTQQVLAKALGQMVCQISWKRTSYLVRYWDLWYFLVSGWSNSSAFTLHANGYPGNRCFSNTSKCPTI